MQCGKHDINYTNLCKRQWLRGCTASSTDTLLNECHGKFLMRHTMSRAAHIFSLAACDVKVYTQENVFLKLKKKIMLSGTHSSIFSVAIHNLPLQGQVECSIKQRYICNISYNNKVYNFIIKIYGHQPNMFNLMRNKNTLASKYNIT